MSGFFRHAAVEHDLEQQIAQLLLEFRHVAQRNRLGHFIGFLDRVGRDRVEILGQIPRATMVLVAQSSHDAGKTV
jgi:hypothetical protein